MPSADGTKEYHGEVAIIGQICEYLADNGDWVRHGMGASYLPDGSIEYDGEYDNNMQVPSAVFVRRP